MINDVWGVDNDAHIMKEVLSQCLFGHNPTEHGPVLARRSSGGGVGRTIYYYSSQRGKLWWHILQDAWTAKFNIQGRCYGEVGYIILPTASLETYLHVHVTGKVYVVTQGYIPMIAKLYEICTPKQYFIYFNMCLINWYLSVLSCH